MITVSTPRLLLALILLSGFSLQALAGEALDNWRIEMVQVRGLAENDIPQAYTKVQRLQSGVPADATPADRVRLLNLLARIELYRGESATVDRYATQALELAAKNGDRIGQAETDMLISLNAVNQSEFERMKAAIHHSMEMLEGSDRKDLLVEAMLRTSMMYLRFSRLDESTAMAMRTLEVARQDSNPLALTYAHQGMAIVYEQSRNYSEAREHYQKMLAYAQDAHSRLLEAGALLGLGAVLSELGSAASGERLVQDAVNIHRKAGGPFFIAHALNMLANFQRKRGNLGGALASLDEAAQIYEQRQNKVGLWWSLRNRSELLEALNRRAQSQADAERGYKLAREMGVALYLGESARRLAVLAAKRGNYKQAYERFAEADEMSRKSEFEKTRKRIAYLAQQFEEESKQRKIIELLQKNEVQVAQQRWLWTGALSSILLLGVTVFFLLRIRRAKRNLQSAYAQLDQTRSKLEATLDAVPDLLFELGLDGTYYDFHSPQSDLLVKPAGQLIGQTISDVLPAKAIDTCLAALQEAHERGISLGKQYELDLPQGHCWFEISVARKPDAGEVPRFIMLARDITERKQTEQHLHKQKQAIIAVVEHSPDAIARYDKQLRRIYVNPATEKLYGMSYDNIVGKTFGELSPLPDDFTQILQSVFESRHELSIELPFRTQEGASGWADIRLVPEFGTDGDIISVLSIGRDITERKRAEDLLREERGLFAGGPTVVFKWRAEAGWPVEYVSPNVLDQFGYAPYQLTEGEISFAAIVHPDDVERVAAEVTEFTGQKRTAYEQEYRIAHADGSYRWIYDFTIVTYQERGNVVHFLGYVLDITERKQAEEELRKHREHLEELVEARTQELRENRQMLNEAQRIARVGSWEMNLVDNILTWSDEVYRIFEMDPQQFGASYEAFMDAVHPDDREMLDQAFKTSLANREYFEIEHRLLLPDGRIKYVFECCESYFDESGRALRSLGTVQDITERKQMEEELAARERNFRSLADNLLDNVARWDTRACYLYINSTHANTLGVAAEDIVGTALPETHAQVRSGIAQVVATGEAISLVRQTLQIDGETQIHEVSLAPEFDAEGHVVSVVGLGRDMTEIYRMQDAIAEREREFRALADSSPGMMGSFLRKPDGSVCMPYASPNIYELFGLHPQDVAEDASAILNLTHPDDIKMVNDTIDESARTMKTWHCEYRIQHPTKGERWMESNTSPDHHPDGGIVWYGYVHDITGRKQAEEALQASELLARSRSNLLSAIVESSPEVIVFALDTGYRYQAFNSRHKETMFSIWGKEIEIGMNMLDVISLRSDRETAKRGFDRALSGESFVEENAYGDEALEREYWQNFYSPIRSESGEVIGLTCFVLNITERKTAETKLQEALEFSEGIINAIPDILLEVDRDGRYLNVWTQNPELLAAQKDMLLGKTVHEVLSPENAAAAMRGIREADEKGVSLGEDICIELPQGKRWFSHTFSKKTGGVSGKVTFLALSRDITGRKKLEEALAESEARYRYHFNQLQSMLESASSVSVFALDREYRYLFFNKRHREGAKRIRGTDIEIGMDMLASIADEEFRAFCRKGFDHVLAGNSVSVESKEKLVRDGNITYEYNDNFGSPIFNDAGEVIGLTVFAINTTERKRLEAELRDSRNFLGSVIDAVPDPIFVKDRQHRWILLNEANCKFTGMPREALIGKSDYDIFPKDEAEVFWKKDELVFESGEVNLNEEKFTSVNGDEHFIQTKKTPFVSADGSQMLVGVIRDITERIHYEAAREAALAEAQRLANLRSEFIAHMSHELRTPLNGILGYAQILARDDALDDKQQASVEVIRHSGEHLLALIEDILDLARIESGRLEFDFSDIPLRAFLNGVAGMVRVRAKEKKISLVTEFAADLPQGVRGDEKRLRQVLLNLLSNAVKFTDQGEVTLRVSRVSPSRLRFNVTDTGIGIAAEDRAKIFKSFEQVSDGRHRIGGTGLGLSISHQLVYLMGGDIEFESTPGAGSTFHFELELPEAVIAPEALPTPIADTQPDELASADEAAETMIAPPQAEMQELYRLALLGNMRDINAYADRIASLDTIYIPFAVHLKRLADSYRSKAILAFVKERLS